MSNSLTSVHNRLEASVIEAVQYHAARYPIIAEDAGLLEDVACVALNHLPARYIRHTVDFTFFRDTTDEARETLSVERAVLSAFEYVYARTAALRCSLVRNLHAEIEWQSATSYSEQRG